MNILEPMTKFLNLLLLMQLIKYTFCSYKVLSETQINHTATILPIVVVILFLNIKKTPTFSLYSNEMLALIHYLNAF